MREAEIARHDGNVWAAITTLAKRGTRAHRDQPARPARPVDDAPEQNSATRSPTRHGGTPIAPHRPRRSSRTRRDAGASDVDAPTGCAPAGVARRGPLLAVCGLCGGAGASTLAYLVALAAARGDPGSVLVADTGGPTGGISYYAGVEAPRSLTEAGRAGRRRTSRPGSCSRPPATGCGCSRPGRGSRADVRARGRSSCCSITLARALRADRDRLRHARPRGRPGRARERLTRRVGAARDRQRGDAAAAACSTRSPRTRRAREMIVARHERATADGRCASCEHLAATRGATW